MARRFTSRYERTRAFTVRAHEAQADRWAEAAALQCGSSVAEWLSHVADAYLKEFAKSSRALPLSWYRGSFRITLQLEGAKEPGPVEVRGHVAGPFGIFRGSFRTLGHGPGPYPSFSLAHRPTRRIIATLSRRKDCMMLAAELRALRIDWDEADPEKVAIGTPDEERARRVIALFKQSAKE